MLDLDVAGFCAINKSATTTNKQLEWFFGSLSQLYSEVDSLYHVRSDSFIFPLVELDNTIVRDSLIK